MARTLDTITTEIRTKIRTFPALDNFKFVSEGGSAVSVFNLFIDVAANAIFLADVIYDALQTDITAVADRAFSGNSQWLRNQFLLFQFGDTITLDSDFVPVYVVVDPSKRIITRVAITERAGGGINVKVAKGIAPALSALTTPELDAVKDFYFGTTLQEGVGFSIFANFISLASDKMKVSANIFYQGQFDSATVKTNVITAIDNFFATFADVAFDGTVFIIRLTDAIQAVEGVSRVVYTDIKARDDATAFASAQTIDFQGLYSTASGYIIAEDTAGQTLNDQITMILETI